MRIFRSVTPGHTQASCTPDPIALQLTELLGGEEAVAEMTGRSGILTRDADGKVTYGLRNQNVSLYVDRGYHCVQPFLVVRV